MELLVYLCTLGIVVGIILAIIGGVESIIEGRFHILMGIGFVLFMICFFSNDEVIKLDNEDAIRDMRNYRIEIAKVNYIDENVVILDNVEFKVSPAKEDSQFPLETDWIETGDVIEYKTISSVTEMWVVEVNKVIQ